jgi:dipeptidase D
MKSVRELHPQKVWKNFEDLNTVPRPSKKEEKVIRFMESFLQSLGLEYEVDQVGNVIARKPATKGMENRRPVVLQAHLDMVHQKNAETTFDFETEGIRSYIDGEWVKAEGTTLGADNGMGVAAIMTVLESTDIPHPPLEALFTIDEESGMTGAHNLQPGKLKGEILMNLDTEDDDELSIGCAGGIDTTIQFEYTEDTDIEEGSIGIEIKISGLMGGHSGMDIIYGRGNANKLLNRFLMRADEFDARLGSFVGGGLRNAIPREAVAHLAVPADMLGELKASWELLRKDLLQEYGTTDPKMKVEWQEVELPKTVMDYDEQFELILAIQTTHDGIRRMSPDVPNLVETSNNLAQVKVKEGKGEVLCLQRSDREEAKNDMAMTIAAPWILIGAHVEHSGSYPGWKLDPNAPMLQMMRNLYVEMYNEEPKVMACHAGLECGLLGQHYPNLEMISFGPTIRHPHSPDEKVHIASVEKFWNYFLAALKRVPEKV